MSEGRFSLLEGFRLIADPTRRVRAHRAPRGHDDLIATMNSELQALHDVAVAVVTPDQVPHEPEPRWRSLMWGEHHATTAREADFVHRIRIFSFNQAPEVVERVNRVAPEPVLISLGDMDERARNRFVDFLFGLSYGRSGEIYQVTDDAVAILVAPHHGDTHPVPSEGQLHLLVEDNDRIDTAG